MLFLMLSCICDIDFQLRVIQARETMVKICQLVIKNVLNSFSVILLESICKKTFSLQYLLNFRVFFIAKPLNYISDMKNGQAKPDFRQFWLNRSKILVGDKMNTCKLVLHTLNSYPFYPLSVWLRLAVFFHFSRIDNFLISHWLMSG